MYDYTGQFENRQQAGRALAEALKEYKGEDCLVLAIPRGGVVVGYEVAKDLDCELDVIVPRKIGAPGQPELAIGAVASWGDHESIIDQNTVRMLGVSDAYIEQEVERQLSEVNRRLLAYRGTTDPPDVAGQTVILVDDGVATGYTTRAAGIALHNLEVERIIIAIPVAPPDSIESLRPYFDEIICLRTPTPFLAVGYWYRQFDQVSDLEVIDILQQSRLRKLHQR